MMPDLSLLIVIALGAIILLLVVMLRRPQGNDDVALGELRGQLAQMASQAGEMQKIIASQMAESEGRLGSRLEQSLRDQNERTTKSLTGMAERLAVITEANAHITELSGQVTQLRNILSNKQACGSLARCSWKIWFAMLCRTAPIYFSTRLAMGAGSIVSSPCQIPRGRFVSTPNFRWNLFGR